MQETEEGNEELPAVPLAVRAEAIDWTNLPLEVVRGDAYRHVKWYLEQNDYLEPCLIMGCIGIGKTFGAMKALRDYCLTASKIPEIHIYKLNSQTEVYDNSKMGLPTGTADVYVYDDINYLLEDVIAGKINLDKAVSLLRHANARVKEGKKVIAIASDLLRVQLSVINDPELDEQLGFFGEFNLSRSDKQYRDTVSFASSFEVLRPRYGDSLDIASMYFPAAADDEYLFATIYAASHNLRGLLSSLDQVGKSCGLSLKSFIEHTKKIGLGLPGLKPSQRAIFKNLVIRYSDDLRYYSKSERGKFSGRLRQVEYLMSLVEWAERYRYTTGYNGNYDFEARLRSMIRNWSLERLMEKRLGPDSRWPAEKGWGKQILDPKFKQGLEKSLRYWRGKLESSYYPDELISTIWGFEPATLRLYVPIREGDYTGWRSGIFFHAALEYICAIWDW